MKASIKTKGFAAILSAIRGSDEVRDKFMSDALNDIGLIVHTTAVDYAPISPTKSQYEATLIKKNKSIQQFSPGGLERSIDYESDENEVSIFVPLNSEAGDYAEFIHDEEYELGTGSEAKGGEVGPKYIERAIEDNEHKIRAKIEGAVKKFIDKTNS